MGKDGKSFMIILANEKMKGWVGGDGYLLQVMLAKKEMKKWIKEIIVFCNRNYRVGG